jgi:hypothetical protein
MIICLSLNSCSKKSTNEKDIEIVDIYSHDESAKIEVINERFKEYKEIIDETIYNNGNGTVLEQITLNGKVWTIRKHEDNYINETSTDFNVYENLDETDGNVLFVLSYEMKFSILEVAYSDDINTYVWSDLWLKIKNEKDLTGWVNVGKKYNPYKYGAWSIIEIIELENKTFTVRKVYTQWLETGPNVKIRDKPSFDGEEVLVNLEVVYGPDECGTIIKSCTIIAMTEETEIIDGKKDPWLKIIDDDGNTGWIFGGDAYVGGRGGFKYRTPHYDIVAPFFPW